MKLSNLTVLALGSLVLVQVACSTDAPSGDPPASTAEALVEEVQDDAAIDEPIAAEDDDLGPDLEPMHGRGDRWPRGSTRERAGRRGRT